MCRMTIAKLADDLKIGDSFTLEYVTPLELDSVRFLTVFQVIGYEKYGSSGNYITFFLPDDMFLVVPKDKMIYQIINS